MASAALGFRAHSGWAVVVAVTKTAGVPTVLDRRRIETADVAIAGSKQPFHAAESMAFTQAQSLISRCRESSSRLAAEAVSAFVSALRDRGHRVAAAAITSASGRPLPDLAAILNSHALIHTAEGELFRDVLVQACEHCSLPVIRIRERECWDRGAVALHLSSEDLELMIKDIGRSIGSPWRQDEKLASLAGWIALAEPAV